MRFAISPAFELVSSLRLFRDPASAALHLPWLEDVRGQISDAELLPLLSLLPYPMSGSIDEFIRPRRRNIRQADFWKAINNDSDDEADPEDRVESQAIEDKVDINDSIEQASIT